MQAGRQRSSADQAHSRGPAGRLGAEVGGAQVRWPPFEAEAEAGGEPARWPAWMMQDYGDPAGGMHDGSGAVGAEPAQPRIAAPPDRR